MPAAVATRVLLVAAAAGLLAQLLFVEQRLGINMLLWVAVVLFAAWRMRRPGAALDRADAWLAPAAVAFAAFVVLRDDVALRAFDVFAAAALTLAAAATVGGTHLTRGRWAGLLAVSGTVVVLVIGGVFRLSAGWSPLARLVGRDARLLPVLRGLLVALPLLILFTLLFAAADAVFARYLQAALDFQLDLPELLLRLLVALLAGWLLAGTIVSAWLSRPIAESEAAGAARRDVRVGRIEVLVVLLVLDAVFGIFVLLQAAYLFGGLDTLAVSGMTYSEYARRGFFELIAVGGLAGGVILALDRLVGERTWAYRGAAVALMGMTAVVLVSAVVRLGLYQAAYGWTELRFYALAAIAWLACGVLATAAALVIDRVPGIPRVMLGAGLVLALVVNVIGPQSFVTGQNLQRAVDPSLVAPGGESGLDLRYLGLLGYDSIPLLIEALPRLAADDRSAADRVLRMHAGRLAVEARDRGWPSWSLPRQRAIERLLGAGYLLPGD